MPASIRQLIRAEGWTGPTAALGRGWVQANLVIVPRATARAFATFCFLNPRPCPLLDITDPGVPSPMRAAPAADLRTDLPRYRVYRRGELIDEPTSIVQYWNDELVGFLIGCSFTFEQALLDAGIRLKHLEAGRNVAMYRTSIPTKPSGPFGGELVVSMRPVPSEQVARVMSVCSRYIAAHGAPITTGDPARLGVRDIDCPDFGDPISIDQGEEPMFWACGVTAELAVASANLDLCITHAPGHMFITDWPGEQGAETLLAADDPVVAELETWSS